MGYRRNNWALYTSPLSSTEPGPWETEYHIPKRRRWQSPTARHATSVSRRWARRGGEAAGARLLLPWGYGGLRPSILHHLGMPIRRANRRPNSDLTGFSTPWDIRATTAINRSKIKWRWIYPLHLFRLRRAAYIFPGNGKWDKAKVMTALPKLQDCSTLCVPIPQGKIRGHF